MCESDSLKSLEELSSQLDAKLTIVDANNYNNALDQILGEGASDDIINQLGLEKVENIIIRSYQDHSESREHLHHLIEQNLPRALDTFEQLSIQSIYTLAGSFSDSESTIPLLLEIEKRIHSEKDSHVKYLLSLIFKFLKDFKYDFVQVSFLIKELCKRIKDDEIRSLTLLIFSRLEKQYQGEFNEKFLAFIESLIIEAEAEVNNDSLSLIVEILSELYPVLTALCSEVFLGKQLVELFQQRVLYEADAAFTKNLLRLFSIACIDETVRVHIAENYISLLEKSLTFKSFKIYSVLVLIKTWSFGKLQNVTVSNLATILMEAFIHQGKTEDDEIAASLEGLAYLSLKPAVKKILRSNESFCNRIIELIKTKLKDSKFYGALVILANMSTYPQDFNSSGNFEPKQIRELRTYYELQNPVEDEKEGTIETKDEVINFNAKYLLENEVLSTLKVDFASLSQGSKQQLVRIIYNVTRDRPSISKCIGQGGTTVILEYLHNDHGPMDLVRILALRALTKMLIFTNPTLIFTKYSPVNAIGPLFELLPKMFSATDSEDKFLDIHESPVTSTDSYEALLSLTNLASFGASEGEDVCKRIVTVDNYWATLENLMLDDNILLQRSVLELISNLMSHPLPIAAKFFNFDNPKSVKNFDILVKLLQLNDINSQRAVAAIFANITSTIPFIAQDLLTKKELIDKAVEVFSNQLDDTELLQRLIIFFYSLIEAIPADDRQKGSLLIGNRTLITAFSSVRERPVIEPQMAEAVSTILASIDVQD